MIDQIEYKETVRIDPITSYRRDSIFKFYIKLND